MIWVNIFHAYQPLGWDASIIRRVVRECYRPSLVWLKEHPNVRCTLNWAAPLTEHLITLGEHKLLRILHDLAERGQIELTTSAYAHPILPLLPKRERQRQIQENTLRNSTILGDAATPRGIFLPELAYDPSLNRTLTETGCSWLVLDEIHHDGRLGKLPFDRLYRLAGAPLSVLFRNRQISDFLFFDADLNDPEGFWRRVAEDGRCASFLVTAMDLENLGHHRPGLDQYWQHIVTDRRVITMTVSEAIAELSPQNPETCHPVAASWATQEWDLADGVPFPLWNDPANPIHQLQWQLTNHVLDVVERSDVIPPTSRDLLDCALSSDQYWWASAAPWWDVAVIRRAADRWINLLDTLSPQHETLNHAISLRETIISIAEEWHTKGTAERRRDAFLRRVNSVRRLGGDVLGSPGDPA